MNLFSLTLILFLIMDPFGNIAYFLKSLQNVPEARRAQVILREMFFALVTILIFNFIGEWIFNQLDLSLTCVKLSSGIILFLSALKILFPTPDSPRSRIPDEEPFIIPLAIPLIAGPSLLATVMLFARIEETVQPMLIGIGIAWILSTIVMLLAERIHRLIGNNGLLALEKLMGMILIMMSIQRFGEGIHQFIRDYLNKA